MHSQGVSQQAWQRFQELREMRIQLENQQNETFQILESIQLHRSVLEVDEKVLERNIQKYVNKVRSSFCLGLLVTGGIAS